MNSFSHHLLSPSGISEIGGYAIGKTIGSFGKVKIGVHKLTKQQVAIKIVDKIYAPAVSREIDTWRVLHHKNIAQLYEVLSSESKIYMITELCTGGEAFDYLVSHGKLPENTCKGVFKQLVDAVQYCHEKNYVHRDLKLENILFHGDPRNPSEPLLVKLIDFGFTKEFKSNKLLDTYCGSVAYAAPEIVEGKKYSGPAADVWSLGVILFTLLCGYLPFDDDNQNEAEINKRILAVEYENPNFLSSDAVDLISKIFISTQTSRISIPDLLSHPWLQTAEAPHRTTDIPEIIDSTIFSLEEENLLVRLELLGFDMVEMIDSVKNHLCNQSSALYYLLLQKSKENQAFHPDDIDSRMSALSTSLTPSTTTTTLSRRTLMLDMMKSGKGPSLNTPSRGGAGGLRSASLRGINSNPASPMRSPRLNPKAAHIFEEEGDGDQWNMSEDTPSDTSILKEEDKVKWQ